MYHNIIILLDEIALVLCRILYYSAANSISWGRLLPQVVYHVTSYLDLVKQKVVSMGDEIDICVPTGNFGNILAAYYAKVVNFRQCFFFIHLKMKITKVNCPQPRFPKYSIV